jgi:vacuolar-type H+-ATPase subunit I/STV1
MQTASLCVERVSQLNRELQNETSNVIYNLAKKLWTEYMRHVQIFQAELQREDGSMVDLATIRQQVRQQELQHTSEEIQSSLKELELELINVVFWRNKADEILKSTERSNDRALSKEYRGVFRSRDYVLTALGETNVNLTKLIGKMEGELQRTRSLQADIEHRMLEFNV